MHLSAALAALLRLVRIRLYRLGVGFLTPQAGVPGRTHIDHTTFRNPCSVTNPAPKPKPWLPGTSPRGHQTAIQQKAQQHQSISCDAMPHITAHALYLRRVLCFPCLFNLCFASSCCFCACFQMLANGKVCFPCCQLHLRVIDKLSMCISLPA
jgi:hypothetical protein